jgi:hypothetical protein
MARSGYIAGAVGLIAAFVAFSVRAAGDADYCRNGSFPETEIRSLALAQVAAGGHVHFLQDSDPGCPGNGQKCLQRAYLIRGDVLLTGRSRGDYVCAFFLKHVGGSAGWLRSRDVTTLPAQPAPSLGAWSGHWRDGDNEIRLSARKNDLVAEGEAYWPGANPPPDQFPGGPNVGEMGGVAHPHGQSAVFGKADECRVELVLFSSYLVVSDNGDCGGMNVRFNGVYHRTDR